MIVAATDKVEIRHDGPEPTVSVLLGDTVLLPAELNNPVIISQGRLDYLEIILPE
jgi:hypothetical protein